MPGVKAIIFLLLAVILGIPFALSLSREGSSIPDSAPSPIVATPHAQQTRAEFGRAFAA